MKQPVYFANKKFLPKGKAGVSLNDLGLQRGYGVFETLRTANGRIFRLNEHLKRLGKSARAIGISLPIPISKIKGKILKTLKENAPPVGGKESLIKIIITAGEEKRALEPAGKSAIFILVNEFPKTNPDFFSRGIKIITFEAPRFLPEVKSLNYLPAVMAMRVARKADAVEAVYKDKNGLLSEGTTSNFFIIKDGELITPRKNILLGITRGEIIKLAKKNIKIFSEGRMGRSHIFPERQNFMSKAIKVLERDIKISEAKKADEAFITSTVKNIMPVVKIDNATIGNGRPGKITKQLMEKFNKVLGNN